MDQLEEPGVRKGKEVKERAGEINFVSARSKGDLMDPIDSREEFGQTIFYLCVYIKLHERDFNIKALGS